MLTLGASLTIRLADTTGATLKEPGSVRVYWGGPADTMRVVDNFPGDKDLTVGVIKVTVSKTNQYKVCFLRSWHYMADPDHFPACRLSTSAAMTIDMGTVIGQKSPMLKMIAKDEFGFLAPGATYEISHPATGFHITLADGTANYDESAGVNGITLYTEPYLYAEKVCEIKPPPKMVLTSPACFTVDNTTWGQLYTHTFTHEHTIS